MLTYVTYIALGDIMDLNGFKGFLTERGLPEEAITEHLAITVAFSDWLAKQSPALTIETATADAARAFIDGLIADGHNTPVNITAICRAGHFFGNNALFVSVLELLDGAEAMGNMYELMAEELGAELRDRVFADTEVPPLGGSNLDKARANREVVKRLVAEAGAPACSKFLSQCMRDLPEAMFEADKELFGECADIDEFLTKKRAENVQMLENLRDNGQLFFSQEVTDAVVEHVRSNPEIMVGAREGSSLFVTKIPYMTKQYLEATDEREKRYHYCHCPWARELIMTDEKQVPSEFCNCSGGFSKKRWEHIFGQELEVELLESVLRGDMRCRFEIKLPE